MTAYIILAFVAVQRFAELVIARRNTTLLKGRGWSEVGAAHYPLIVGFHALWLLGLFVLAPWARVNGWLVGMFAFLQLMRLWVLTTLGSRWTTRVLVKPGEALVARGPYRFTRHPNYVAVALEIFVLPLALGFPIYALIGGLINLLLLALRISVEDQALRHHRSYRADT